MSGNVGARVVSDTGSTTGIATAILALLSAGTMASISLVGAHQLSLPGPARLRADAPSVVRAPKTVVVTPHAATPTGAEPAQHHVAKAHRSPADVNVAPAVLTSHAPTHKATIGTSAGGQVTPPKVTLPSVAPVPTVLPTPVVVPPTPAPTDPGLPYPRLSPAPVPTVPIHSRDHGVKAPSTRVDAYQPSHHRATAVLGEKIGNSRGQSNACGEHSSRDDAQPNRSVAGHDAHRAHGGDSGRHNDSHYDGHGHDGRNH